MNLVISVLSGGQPSRHTFGPGGGRFGRSQKCDWVLQDPECILSSVHGRIHLVNGSFVLVDESTNGIFIGNHSEPIGKGNSVFVSDGMRFRAGAYVMEIRFAPEQVTRPAYEAPMGYEAQQQPAYAPPPQSFHNPPSTYGQGMPAVLHASRAEDALRQRGEYGDLWNSNSQDPLAYLDGTASAPRAATRQASAPPAGFYPDFPEAGPLPGQPLPPMQATASHPAAAQSFHPPSASQPYPLHSGSPVPEYMPAGGVAQPWSEAGHVQDNLQRPAPRGGIPDDFFASLTPRPASLQPQPQPFVNPAPVVPAPAMPALPPAEGHKAIPDNFDPFTSLNFKAAKMSDPVPMALTPRPEIPVAVPTVAAPVLPVLPDMVTQPAAERPRPVEQLSPALLADVIKIEPPMPAAEKRAASADKAAFDPLEALRSRREERTAALERKARGQAPLPEPPLPAPVQQPMPAALPLPDMMSAAQPYAAMPSRDATVAALFRGMGFAATAPLPADGEKVAESVGLMVREIAEGLVQLLSARQMLKSEFRMDETQMRPEENNPFKYYKIAELALDELFVTKSGGFQDPAQAAASAFADIQQYVMLTTSAIQRAMTLMFQRLSPEAIVREAEGDGGLRIRGLGVGKGKWETYVENHARMSGRLDGITRQIISEAFAQVQEEQARKQASEYWEKKK